MGRAGHPQAATVSLSPTPQPWQEQETRTNPSFCPFGKGWGLWGGLESIVSHSLDGNIQCRVHPAGAANPRGSALFRNCSASYLGQQFRPWEPLSHYPPISALKPALIPRPDLSKLIFQRGILSPTGPEPPCQGKRRREGIIPSKPAWN